LTIVITITAVFLLSGCEGDKLADIPVLTGNEVQEDACAPEGGGGMAQGAAAEAGNDFIKAYTSAGYEGRTDGVGAFLVCGTNGRLDRIYEDNKVENIPNPASGRDLTQVFAGPDATLVSGMSGIILYSYDGKEFHAGGGVGGADVSGVTFFKGRYFASTLGGAVLESADGKEWKISAELADAAIISIAASREHIMAITTATDIFISEDGNTWNCENFNVTYDGYYEKYVFTKIIGIDYALYILGYCEDNPGNPIIMFSDSGGEVWMFRTLAMINELPAEDFYPLEVYSLVVFDEELVAICNNGKVLVMPSCFKCNEFTEPADMDFRDLAAGDGILLFVGDGYEYALLNAFDLQRIDNID